MVYQANGCSTDSFSAQRSKKDTQWPQTNTNAICQMHTAAEGYVKPGPNVSTNHELMNSPIHKFKLLQNVI